MYVGIPLALFGLFIAYQTTNLRFTFDDTQFSLVKVCVSKVFGACTHPPRDTPRSTYHAAHTHTNTQRALFGFVSACALHWCANISACALSSQNTGDLEINNCRRP
jgi:hypothetical protein